jgi:renalase
MLIVGAGLAGLAAAQDLKAAGQRVQVLDKARGVSGRAATRTRGKFICDHGAQFFTARGERLEALCWSGLADGWLQIWTRGFAQYRAGVWSDPPLEGFPRYAPHAGMNILGKVLGKGLEVGLETQITHVKRIGRLWELSDSAGNTYQDEHVIFNLPAPQLIPLLRDVWDVSPLEPVQFDPCFALMVTLEQDLNVPWKAAQLEHPVLSWIARDHTKRPTQHRGDAAPVVLVVHASGTWSKSWLKRDLKDVQAEMLLALREVLGDVLGDLEGKNLQVKESYIHRWLYAQPTVVFPATHFWDAQLGLGWCGDWCGAAKVEGAVSSGWAVAEAVLNG